MNTKDTNLVEGVNLDGGLVDGGEGPLGTLASRAETTESTGIVGDVELGLLLELVLEEIEEVVVKVLTTKMGVTRGGLDGEDTTRDVQEGDIESSSSEIEDEDVLLGLGLAVETVGDGGGGGLVDDTENLETGDGTSILGSETLRVVEVGGDTRRSSDQEPERRKKISITHVTTAFLTVLPSLASEISFILVRTIAEISWGEKVLSSLR